MNMPLPTKLAREPLLDAVFEVRFAKSTELASLLPGYLFSKLQGLAGVEALPASQMPKVVRESDPTNQLMHAPLVRLHWGQFAILIGDTSVAIACKLPYPGWRSFRPAIEEVLRCTFQSKLVDETLRYSMKYVDLLQTGATFPAANQVDWALRLGPQSLTTENIQLRVEIPRDGFLHAISIATAASVQMSDGSANSGAVVDVDTIQQNPSVSMELMEDLTNHLDAIHLANKQVFFGCLSKAGLAALEPVYE